MPRKRPRPTPEAPKRAGSRHKPRKMIALPPDEYELLARTASEDCRSIRDQVRFVLREFFAARGIEAKEEQSHEQ